jgi:hypothetical protein
MLSPPVHLVFHQVALADCASVGNHTEEKCGLDFGLLMLATGWLIKFAAKRRLWPIDRAVGAVIAVPRCQGLLRILGNSGRPIPLLIPHCAAQRRWGRCLVSLNPE